MDSIDIDAAIGRLRRLQQNGQLTEEERRLLDGTIRELQTVAKQIAAASKKSEQDSLLRSAVWRIAWWIILSGLDWPGGCGLEL